MRGLHLLVIAALGLLIFVPPVARAHEGEHEEEGSYSTDEDSRQGKYLPVRRRRLASLPQAPTEIRATGRAPRTQASKLSLGVFLSLDLPVGSAPDEDLMLTSGTTHRPGDQHQSSDGHDHHHAVRAINGGCPPGVRCHGGEDHSAPVPDGSGVSGSSSTIISPVATVKAGYAFSRVVSFGLNISTDFSNGIRDPTVGPNFLFSIASRYKGMLNLTASIPVSATSRENGKITTLTGSLNTLYHSHDGYFLGGGGFVAGSFYGSIDNNPSSSNSTRFAGNHTEPHTQTPTTPQKSAFASESNEVTAVELVRTGGNLFAGLMLSDRISGNVSLGLGTTYKDDDSFGWLTDLTVARLAYSVDGFMGAVAFSFLSDQKGTENITFPTQPFFGFKLQYVFGSLSTIGIVGTDSVGGR